MIKETKTISESHKKTLKKAREKALKIKSQTEGLVCKIGNDIEIWADKYQYILKISDQYEYVTYHATIAQALSDLLEYKEKQLMIESERKDIISIQKAITDAREWIKEVVKPALKDESS